MRKNESVRKHPLYQEEETLDFGTELEVGELTNDQKATAFLSKYMEVVNPIERYEKYFQSTAKDIDHILRDVKLYFKKLVLDKGWSERKYVAVINDIFENKIVFSIATLDRGGLMYDKEALASQKRVRNVGNTARRRT